MSVVTAPELVRPEPAEANLKVTTPEEDHQQLINTVVPDINKTMPPTVVPFFTKAQATPAAAQPIPSDNAGHIQPGIHAAKPFFDTEDFTDRTKRALGHVISSAGAVIGVEEQSNYNGMVPGSKVAPILHGMHQKRGIGKRIINFLHRQKAA